MSTELDMLEADRQQGMERLDVSCLNEERQNRKVRLVHETVRLSHPLLSLN